MSGRPSAETRLQRLIVMVPWIIREDGPLVEDVCKKFNVKEADLAADLEMLFLCGLYPFTPDSLIEADIVGGRVWIRSADQFQAPPRFTANEAVALMAAGSAAAALPGNEDNDVLHSALQKLAKALGIEDDEVVDVDLAPATRPILDKARSATETHHVLKFDYYSYGRDAWGCRVVKPLRMFNADGQWSLAAMDTERDDVRNFRIDRMTNVVVQDETFDPPAELPEAKTYQPRKEDPAVVLELDPQASWVVDQYPTESVTRHENGVIKVTLRISEQAWLERLLLRLAKHARVAQGEDVGAKAAQRILARYDL
jgi:proteasome accessory factor C